MIGLDTNVFLRFLLKDDPVQTAQARALFRSLTPEEPGWASTATILEIAWVLMKSKRLERALVAKTITDLLALDTIVVEQAGAVAAVVRQFQSTRADFADCLIAALARVAGCKKTVTFDENASRDAGMELLK